MIKKSKLKNKKQIRKTKKIFTNKIKKSKQSKFSKQIGEA